ncbi:Ribosome recycling factor [Fulvivirga imtechensis AK7]|uniref:Ribosome-recycling factor n=1 Tax=Fulvivirga imtechensis AK7 TaxID=1237149 RepID=L8JYB2_9BACT|nr:ribosome recycling factor [Fulvivirga imtechensis]ELR72639.1 Ribosome recycling factor [Fulvivirga imtechensis AK7]
MEEINMYLDEARDMMNKAIKHVSGELVKIRAGKASPTMLEGLMVEYYGNPTPINQVASVTAPDARTLMIKPWEKTVIPDIEKAIINSDLGLNPQNDGQQVIINIPQLTEERRLTLVKQVKHEGEQGKVSVRNIRKETNDNLKQLQKEGASEDDIKRAEDKVQALTDEYTKKIDEILAKKESEIMTV